MITQGSGKHKALWRVVYETGDPDNGTVQTHEITTRAVSVPKAISNAWWRCGRQATFFVRQVERLKEDKPCNTNKTAV